MESDPYLDEDIQSLALTEGEIDDVVAFLTSLTSSDYRERGFNGLARQRELLPDNASPTRYRERLRS